MNDYQDRYSVEETKEYSDLFQNQNLTKDSVEFLFDIGRIIIATNTKGKFNSIFRVYDGLEILTVTGNWKKSCRDYDTLIESKEFTFRVY